MRRLWGCYSVADHLEPRAFVADLLLYDRLVVPVPEPADLPRWRKHWDPERQATLLAIAEPFVERVVWNGELRDEHAQRFSVGIAGEEINSLSRHAAGVDAYELTRRMVSDHLRERVVEAAGQSGDVRAVAVYARPDRFSREWSVERSFPYVRRRVRVEPGELREVARDADTNLQHLAKLVVTRLVVPDDGATDAEVLQRTVDLISRKDVSGRRLAFQELIASLQSQGISDDTVVGEVGDLVDSLNAAVRAHTKAQVARTSVHVVTAAEGLAALWAPPVAVATGATAAVGEAWIRRRWDESTTQPEEAVQLMAEAQDALRNG